ncbi:hypothetical protein V6N12_058443 [Hibiscus sabdariffa]|uniref:Uncharacterized protein n=1 Tax=Hibiscus sabdariffa TaxID=183260 RepID=A0ABR2ES57_9ROSI
MFLKEREMPPLLALVSTRVEIAPLISVHSYKSVDALTQITVTASKVKMPPHYFGLAYKYAKRCLNSIFILDTNAAIGGAGGVRTAVGRWQPAADCDFVD